MKDYYISSIYILILQFPYFCIVLVAKSHPACVRTLILGPRRNLSVMAHGIVSTTRDREMRKLHHLQHEQLFQRLSPFTTTRFTAGEH